MAVLLHSLAYLPCAAQRRLQPWQLILCLGSSDKAVDSALATDLGLQLLHVDTSRAEEVADSVMALLLGLIRYTHLLSKQGFSTFGWLGSLQGACSRYSRPISFFLCTRYQEPRLQDQSALLRLR